MTNMAPPPPPKTKPKPPTLLEILLAAEQHLEIRTTARDIAQREFGPDPARDREIRLLELITEMAYTVSFDGPRYAEFVRDIRRTYGRWIPPGERVRRLAETEPADEEATDE